MRALVLRSNSGPDSTAEILRERGWEVVEADGMDVVPFSERGFSLISTSGDAASCHLIRESSIGGGAYLVVRAVTPDVRLDALLHAGADDVLLHSASPAEIHARLAVAERRCAEGSPGWGSVEKVWGAALEELIQLAPEGIAVTDPQTRVLHVNGEFTRIFGYTPAEAVGLPLDELVVPDDRHEEGEALTRTVRSGERVCLETVRRRRDGSRFHASVLAAPIYVKGTPVGLTASTGTSLSGSSPRTRSEKARSATGDWWSSLRTASRCTRRDVSSSRTAPGPV